MSTLSRVGQLARQHDPDRFLTSLFAPAAARPALWALYAFNHELARARESVREPMMAMIRLQWWREVVEGAKRRHEVAEPLSDALATGALQADDMLSLIDGREADPPETDAQWIEHVQATSGTLAVAAGRVLGIDHPAILAAGAAYGAAGVLRNRALAGAGSIAPLAAAGLAWVAEVKTAHIPRQAVAAWLPAVLAARDLRRSAPVTIRGLADKLAVTSAAVRGRL
jgi:phytoene synthase